MCVSVTPCTLNQAECLGACVNAPMMQIAGPICNDAYYEVSPHEIHNSKKITHRLWVSYETPTTRCFPE